MQDIKPIRVFLEVARQRSFAAAARDLNMTPATVTRMVARLEETLGVQLLLRTTRQVSLTSEGAVVAARYAPLLDELDAVTDEITRAARPDRGRLRVNAPISMGLRLLPDLIDGFRLAYPNVELDLSLTDRLIDIMDAPCDLAIRISQAPADKSTIWRKICAVPRRVIAAPALFNRIDRPDHPDALNRDLCLSYSSEGQPETWEFSREQSTRSLRAGAGLITNNGDLIYALVRRGVGMAVLPDFIVEDGLARGEVVPVLEDWAVTPLWLTLYYPPYEQLPPLVATFSDFFEDYLRQNRPHSFNW